MTSLSIGHAWDEAKVVIARRGGVLLTVALALITLPVTLAGLMRPAVDGPAPGSLGGPAMLLAIAASLWGQMAMALIAGPWDGSVGQAIGLAARRLWRPIAASLMIMVPLILLCSVLRLVAVGPTALAGGAATPMTPAGAMVILLFIAMIVAVTVRLCLIGVVAVREELSVTALLRRSLALSRGHFWKLLAMFLLLVIASLVITMSFGSVLGLVIAKTIGTPRPWSIGALLTALFGGLVQAGYSIVFTVMLVRIHAQLTGDAAIIRP